MGTDVQLGPLLGSDTPPSLTFHSVAGGWAPWAGAHGGREPAQLGSHPALPRMTLSSFILLVQVSAKGTQMQREKSGLGLYGGGGRRRILRTSVSSPGKKLKIRSSRLVSVGSHAHAHAHRPAAPLPSRVSVSCADYRAWQRQGTDLSAFLPFRPGQPLLGLFLSAFSFSPVNTASFPLHAPMPSISPLPT